MSTETVCQQVNTNKENEPMSSITEGTETKEPSITAVMTDAVMLKSANVETCNVNDAFNAVRDDLRNLRDELRRIRGKGYERKGLSEAPYGATEAAQNPVAGNSVPVRVGAGAPILSMRLALASATNSS